LTDTGQRVEHLSPVGEAVLRALAEYRYLTAQQMLDIGVAKDRGHLGKVLNGFLTVTKREGSRERRPKEIGELDYGVRVGRGRLPRIYYLAKRGAELLEFFDPDSAPVPYPPRVRRRGSDYFHQLYTVDFHIALRQWADAEGQNLTWLQYFDWWPAADKERQHPVTLLKLEEKNIVADAVFRLRDDAGKERTFAFEMANGMDTGRVVKQMQNYCVGLEDESISNALGLGRQALRIIYVFEHRRLLELVQKRANSNPLLQDYEPHFFLSDRESLAAENLQKGWQRITSSRKRVHWF
jgi:protein involved in plasmid replication-relaxation